jgi:malonyl-CoA decarboxylase
VSQDVVAAGDRTYEQTMSEPGKSLPTDEASGTAEQTPEVPASQVTIPPLFARFRASLRNRASARVPEALRDAQHVIKLCGVMLSERGDVSGVRLAGEALAAYQELGPTARDAFFELLSGSFLPDPKFVAAAATAYQREPSAASLSRLQAAVESPRQELFRRLNLARGGIAVLMDMRRNLLEALDRHPNLGVIDADLAGLFRTWFNGGFLILKRIDWRTSAVILERLIQYEAVHQIQGWDDLRRRLEADRRCYAFFHPALPDEPLIFIEVALTRGLGARVQPLLDPHSPVVKPDDADSALFYSITNCQDGLRGVSLGNLLIKQVVEDLERSFPRLRRFATLSPIPGFRKWLTSVLSGPTASAPRLAHLRESLDGQQAPPAIAPSLQDDLMRLCAYYLLHAKHGKAPLDPVARFHLANGAQLHRLNWRGDTSEAGMRRSFGIMANYMYRISDLERNYEAYTRDYTIASSSDVTRLARRSPASPA